MPTNTEEERLVQRIRSGDATALAELMELSRGQLLATAARKMSDVLKRSVEPDDVVQETITCCLKTFPALDCTALDPMPWIHQVLERRVVDAHRHFAAQKRSADKGVSLSGATDSSPGLIDMLVASMTSASQAFARSRREERLMRAMLQLTQEQQDALRMRYVENRPSKEIAEVLQKSDGAVRVMLTRSLRQLEELLDEGSME
jgi:RNA polymerase sigma-70 factor (ECF subfamily)